MRLGSALRSHVSRRFPDPVLALISIVWLAGAVGGTVLYLPAGRIVVAALFLVPGILALGLWAGWTWVRVPLFLINAAGTVVGALLIAAGHERANAARTLLAAYAAYLVWTWWPPMKPPPARPADLREVVRLLARCAVLLAAILLAAVPAGNAAARRWASRNDAGWARLHPDAATFDATARRAEPTSAARELECLSAKLGLDIATVGPAGRCRPDPVSVDGFHESNECARAWLRDELARASSAIHATPPELERLFHAHAGTLDAIEALALSGQELAWERDASLLYAQPLPNLRGQIALHRILVSLALHRASHGEVDGARRALEACWQIAADVRDRPEMTSLVVATTLARYEVGALRKIPGAPGAWASRLGTLGNAHVGLRAAAFESWLLGRGMLTATLGERAAGDWKWRLGGGFLQSPWGRVALALSAEDLRARQLRAATELGTVDPCAFDPEAFDRAWVESIPRWNLAGKSVSGIARPWSRVASLRSHAELTRLVLLAEEQRSRTGSYPAALDTTPREACPGAPWRYELGGDGSLSITSSREPPGDPYGFPVATRFVAAPPEP